MQLSKVYKSLLEEVKHMKNSLGNLRKEIEMFEWDI